MLSFVSLNIEMTFHDQLRIFSSKNTWVTAREFLYMWFSTYFLSIYYKMCIIIFILYFSNFHLQCDINLCYYNAFYHHLFVPVKKLFRYWEMSLAGWNRWSDLLRLSYRESFSYLQLNINITRMHVIISICYLFPWKTPIYWLTFVDCLEALVWFSHSFLSIISTIWQSSYNDFSSAFFYCQCDRNGIGMHVVIIYSFPWKKIILFLLINLL